MRLYLFIKLWVPVCNLQKITHSHLTGAVSQNEHKKRSSCVTSNKLVYKNESLLKHVLLLRYFNFQIKFLKADVIMNILVFFSKMKRDMTRNNLFF